MGDRALIQFKNSNEQVSPVCYVHWHGQETPELIRECAKLMESRGEDLEYAFARFVGICHERIEGNTSLGVWNEPQMLSPGDSHGDAGVFLVHCGTWEVEAFGGYGEPFNAANAEEDDEPETDPENIYGLPGIQQSIEDDRK